MRRLLVLVVLAASLAGCMAKPIPDGYSGPTANVRDTSTPRGSNSVDFFYLAEIDGRRIPESRGTTAQVNYGRGFAMTPAVIGRDIPARPSSVRIVGRTHYAAPILALINKVYEVSGTIQFAPEPDRSYVVKGVLGDSYSAVWIEDAAGKQVGEKIEMKGSTALGILEK